MPEPSAAQAFQLALRHHQANRLADAEQLYIQLLDADPGNAAVLGLLGMLCSQAGRHEAAVDLLRRAIPLVPDAPQFAAHLTQLGNCLGQSLVAISQPDQAAQAFEHALAHDPNNAEIHFRLGDIAAARGEYERAITLYQQSARLKEDCYPALANLGRVCLLLARYEEGLLYTRRAMRIKPDDPLTLNNLAVSLSGLGRADEALDIMRRNLGLLPHDVYLHSNFLFMLLYDPACSPEQYYEEHVAWSRRHADSLKPAAPRYDNKLDADRPLRIGYVSPDWRAHPVGLFMQPILAAHDHSQYPITCYSDVLAADAYTARLQSHADHWQSIAGLSDEQVAERVRADQIDILVDLTGHTAHHRLLVFARKPAPIQISYLGYQNTSGLWTIDYRITDAQADPPGLSDRYYTEKLHRLPESFFAFQPPSPSPEVSQLPALSKGTITFVSFNNLAKVNVKVVQTWSKVLLAVPGSRLLLSASEPPPALALFERQGVGAERISLLSRRPYEEYLQQLSEADIALDPFPFNGHTTTCDALWMGVPVVALAGNSYASRMGVSILTNLKLPELIASTQEEYVAIATALANDLPRLSGLRSSLRQRMLDSVVTDEVRFTRNLESSYRQLWRSYCEQHAP